VRASESSRALVCPASLVLPRTRSENPRRDAKAAKGTAMHLWKETGVVTPDIEKKIRTSGVQRERWYPTNGGGRHEVTFAIQAFTEELVLYDPKLHLVSADDWKKSFDPRKYLTGTIDWLDGTHVDDLKTGDWPVSAEESKQLRSYALVPYLLRGKPSGYRGLVSITQWTWYPLAGQPVRNWDVVTGAELELFLDDVRYTLEHPEVVNPTDEGCKFCESKGHCPAWSEN